MELNNEPQRELSRLSEARSQLSDDLTGVLEQYDESLDIHEMAIELSKINDRGKQLLREMDIFLHSFSGPGGPIGAEVETQVESLMKNLTDVLANGLPEVLMRRLMEERDNTLFGAKAPTESSVVKGEDVLVHEADMHMYPIYLSLLSDAAVDGALLEPVFAEALDNALTDLDADGVARAWGAMSADTANLSVDKKWIAARPKVADRVVKVYLTALERPDMALKNSDIPRLQEFENLLRTYDLLNVIGSPLREKYQKSLDEIKRRG